MPDRITAEAEAPGIPKNFFVHSGMPKLYHELAVDWYQLLTPLEEYKEEADLYHKIFEEKQSPAPQTILELGSGAGHNGYYLKEWYHLTLTDISDNMLSISRKLNPECDHIQGDMKTLRIDKLFDAVFIHDAIMYMTTADELTQALTTAYIHCKPRGMVLISPDYIRETFTESIDDGGSNNNGRALRYLEWKHDPDPNDSFIFVDYAYMLRDVDGSVKVEHDHHVEGIFGEKVWLSSLAEIGFQSETLPDSFGRINFLAHKSGT